MDPMAYNLCARDVYHCIDRASLRIYVYSVYYTVAYAAV